MKKSDMTEMEVTAENQLEQLYEKKLPPSWTKRL